MKYIKDMDVKNKKVILRLDLNVTIKDGTILDDTKIRKSLPTIHYLLNQGAHILVLSHLGKIKNEDDKKKNTLLPVSIAMENLLGQQIKFIPNTRGKELEKALQENVIVMMENTRYEDIPNALESKCDESLSSYWASLGDVFINDAFGTTHRKHASNYGISKYLESGYGFLIEEELNGLKPIVENIAHPFVVIMGGAKVDDKIALMQSLLKDCDALLVGGGIANTFLKAKSYNIGSSLYSEAYMDAVKEILTEYSDKIFMPEDVLVQRKDNVEKCSVLNISDGDCIYDLGPKTLEKYASILKTAKTIFINGTMGLYENEQFREGTEGMFKTLEECKGIKIAGGGDALASANTLGYASAFDFLSTGGGASLEYIAEKHLKCFEE